MTYTSHPVFLRFVISCFIIPSIIPKIIKGNIIIKQKVSADTLLNSSMIKSMDRIVITSLSFLVL